MVLLWMRIRANDGEHMSNTVLQGSIESIIYQNEQNGYTVFEIMVSTDESIEKITCLGYTSAMACGEDVQCTGEYVMHPSYGRQFRAEFIEKVLPTTLSGMEKYLGSGVIPGIGEKTAAKIIAEFGEKTFEVMELDPVRLSRIRGISVTKALAMGEAFVTEAGNRNTMMYLQKMGLSANQAQRVVKTYKSDAINIVKENPYKLADDVFGIGFKIADDIAKRNGMPANSPFRIMAGVKFVLNQALNNGHCPTDRRKRRKRTRQASPRCFFHTEQTTGRRNQSQGTLASNLDNCHVAVRFLSQNSP